MVKVERRKEAPASLAIEKQKKTENYRGKDVVEALKEDFYDKCYICGIKEPQAPEIEHRIPHRGNRDLMFDWNNLFWVCSHCNSVKKKEKYSAGIIDCCVDNPEERLSFRVVGDEISAVPIEGTDSEAVLTAELIYETFNQENTALRTVTCKRIRNGLLQEMNKLYKAIEDVGRQPNSKMRKRVLEALLARESSFAEYKRSYYREHVGVLSDKR